MSDTDPTRLAWEDAQNRQEFEHDLINRKTTWLLTTQGLLFAAYGVTFRDEAEAGAMKEFREVVAWTGISLSVVSLFGVIWLIDSKRMSWKDYQEAFGEVRPAFVPKASWPHGKAPFGVRTWNTWFALFPEVVYPLVFVGAWACLVL